jgi:RIP metalloprotease RseP
LFQEWTGRPSIEANGLYLAGDAGPVGRLAQAIAATGIIFRETGAGYDYGWHPAPQRQFVIMLEGEVDIEAVARPQEPGLQERRQIWRVACPRVDAMAVEEGLAVDAVGHAVEKTWDMSVLTIRMIWNVATGDVSVKNLSGPINIAEYAGFSARQGILSFLSFLAVVSVSLFVLNLLPIPILDGGQVVYQLAEVVKGSPLSERAQAVGQQIGILLLLMLMSFAFYNDLSRLFS